MDELAERVSKSRSPRNGNSGPEEDHKGRSHQDREPKVVTETSKKVVPEKRH